MKANGPGVTGIVLDLLAQLIASSLYETLHLLMPNRIINVTHHVFVTVSGMAVFKKGKSIRDCRRRAFRSLHNFRDSRVEFYASGKQPVSKRLYTESYTFLLELLKIIRTGQQAIPTMEALIGRKTRTVLC